MGIITCEEAATCQAIQTAQQQFVHDLTIGLIIFAFVAILFLTFLERRADHG